MKKTFIISSIIIRIFIVTSAQEQLKRVSDSERMIGLSTFWKEVSYNFVNFNDTITPQKWDSLYYVFLPKVLNCTSDYQYFRLMEEFASFLCDQHTGIFMDENRSHMDYLPISPLIIDTSVYVISIPKSFANTIPIGSRIIRLDRLSILEFFKQNFASNTYSSTIQSFNYQASNKMFSGIRDSNVLLEIVTPIGDTLSVEMIRNGKTIDDSLYINSPLMDELFFKKHFVKKLSPTICLITIPDFQLKKEKFESLIGSNRQILESSKNIIIDLRDNTGGNGDLSLYLAKIFINRDSIKELDWETRENIGAYRAWGATGFIPEYAQFGNMTAKKFISGGFVKNEGFKVDANLVILINAGSCSSAENFILYLKVNHKKVTLIGTTSAGSTGSPLIVQFPGGWGRVCAKTNYDENNLPFVRKGINPDIYMDYSFDNLMNGGDAVMEKAIEVMNSSEK